MFGHVRNRLDKKAKVYDVMNWETNYNTHIAQYLRK